MMAELQYRKQKQKTERQLKHSLEVSRTAKLGEYSQCLCRLQIINTLNNYLVEFKGPICNTQRAISVPNSNPPRHGFFLGAAV